MYIDVSPRQRGYPQRTQYYSIQSTSIHQFRA